MKHPKTLQAFTSEEYERAHSLLAMKVATMMGRKLEEGDWNVVYCEAKRIPCQGWSNLNIDIVYDGLGIEAKMLCTKSNKKIKEYCGTTQMHPAATRSIRIPSLESDPTETARNVLKQYSDLILERRRNVAKTSGGKEPDMRTGWLLWQESLHEFLYFEEEMLPPNPEDYIAEWKESGGGSRKKSKNLWVYEVDSGIKRYSITTSAGAKIQPYFNIPPPTDKNLYYFKVQGEVVEGGLVRIWITRTTMLCLKYLVEDITPENLSKIILKFADDLPSDDSEIELKEDDAYSVLITEEAYNSLCSKLEGLSDEHMFQLLINCLQQQ